MAQMRIKLTANIERFIPRALARISPRLALLDALDTPMTGELAVDLSSAGEIRTADLALKLDRGSVFLPTLGNAPMELDSGQLALRYEAGKQQLTLAPSTLNWAGSRVTLVGSVSSEPPAKRPSAVALRRPRDRGNALR